MAFMDNSGDIIMDAVLTETGRRHMANGNFRITKFALGDDEINYGLYDKNHPSGSAYYDLSILQTPMLEAFTQINASINYGLMTMPDHNIFYLPVVKVNDLAVVDRATTPSDGVFYVTDNSNDTASTTIEGLLTDAGISFINGTSTGKFVLLESGINSGVGNVPNGTSDDRNNYLVNNGLVDRQVKVFYDPRFFSTIYGPSPSSRFDNNGNNNQLQQSFNLQATQRTNLNTIGISNYVSNNVTAITNGIVDNTSGLNTAATNSVIAGPRASATCLAFRPQLGLEAEYTLYGSTKTIGGTACQIIDTVAYVQGTISPVSTQLQMRIIRLP